MTELSLVVVVAIAFCLGAAIGCYCAMWFFKWQHDAIMEQIYKKMAEEMHKGNI